MKIEIIYASKTDQFIHHVELDAQYTLKNALKKTNVISTYHIDLSTHKIGVWGNIVGLDYQLKEGDRIEIYRPLINDPKEIRQRRVKQNKTRR